MFRVSLGHPTNGLLLAVHLSLPLISVYPSLPTYPDCVRRDGYADQ
jgi:hypothetical protein